MPATNDEGGNVKVVVRIRPTNQLETKKGGTDCVRLKSETEIELATPLDGDFKFTFDRVLGPKSTQQECFDCVAAPITEDVLSGYNATIFAYGQTSSGKTFTMEGPDIYDPETRGIIPRALSALFTGVLQANANIEFTVKVGYIEIYMERIRDLLDQFRTKVNLSVREDPRTGVYVAGVTEEYCTSEADLLRVMQQGALNRAVAATGMNEGSSRSHSVFMVTVEQRNLETNNQKAGKMFLVDLAGSEMVRKTNATGQQLEEAKTINKSLSALGLVINALTEEKPSHIPYRDSKLTRVLQDSLGGNAKTALLINCSPSSYNAMETLSTLRFGSRAKSITNKPKINEQRSVEELQVLLQKAENAIDMQQSYIVALEGQVAAGGGGAGFGGGGSGEGGENEGAAVVALQSKMAGIVAELSEEREEVTRSGNEVEKLTALLKEKERLVQGAGELLLEAEVHCDAVRSRAETLDAERSTHVDDAAAAAEALKEAEMRFEFECQELKVRLETLTSANEKLQRELETKEEEAEGEADGSGGGGGKKKRRAAAAKVRLGDEAAVAAARAVLGDNNDEAVIAKFVEFFKGREGEWEAWAASGSGGGGGGGGGDDEEEESERCAKLSSELQMAAEKNMELEMQVSSLKAATGGAAAAEAEKLLSTRERNHLRMQKKFESLQQRLEQLVAVHRQLLRKYAALELVNAEDKKKIALRDERIAQLEANTRTLAMNMRTQAARHVVELTKLREQVSSVRQEQMEARIESQNQQSNTQQAGGGGYGGGYSMGGLRSVIRGGGASSSSSSAAGSSCGGGGALAGAGQTVRSVIRGGGAPAAASNAAAAGPSSAAQQQPPPAGP